ncbi:polysaccharide pyruvyl transferase family protein [Formosa haliotis]|uniref:polysaccharide pyruvyl transferase family protein n=1 Tax=Formosa haliotis TaxID=1555194 RepID=UPI00082676D7|nr:polysaccharide pyruvyl transferase family protein [Formosa haliotis]
MKLIYYKSDNGNFGDDLNVWLWPQLFGDHFFDTDSDCAFFGVGSILIANSKFIDEANTFKHKVIFGTGVRSVNESVVLNDSWEVMFLRGPYSSLKLMGDLDHYIADAAYCLALLPKYNSYLATPKAYKISFIPYFKSLDKVNWQKICDMLGWHLISPTHLSVEEFILEVAASESVISEAMHGTILADVLRVPWKRCRFYAHVYEGEKVSEWKWNDWLLSIGFSENTFIDATLKPKKGFKNLLKPMLKFKDLKKVCRRLEHHDTIDFRLSSPETLNKIVAALEVKTSMLKTKLKF